MPSSHGSKKVSDPKVKNTLLECFSERLTKNPDVINHANPFG